MSVNLHFLDTRFFYSPFILFLQSLMVDGLIGLIGINVRRHVGVVFTGEPEPAPIQVLHMVDENVKGRKMKGEIAILMNAVSHCL